MREYDVPLRETGLDCVDKLKSVSRGYASMDYEFKEYRASDVVKVDMLLNGEKVDALSIIVHRSQSQYRGRAVAATLRDISSRHQVDVALQAASVGNANALEPIMLPPTNVLLPYHQLFLTPGTQELAPHITIPSYNPTKGLTGRRYDKLMWATVLLSNVDTLEVFEEAIRQAGEQPPEEAPADQELGEEKAAEGSSRLPSVQQPTNTGKTNRRGGGRGTQPRPTKTQDKDKEPVPYTHMTLPTI